MGEHLRDGVRVSVSGVPGWIGFIDLDAGVLIRRVHGTVQAPRALPAETLRAVRDGLEQLHPLGDRRVRVSQFMEGEVGFELTLGGATVTQSFVGDGRPLNLPMELLFEVACGRFDGARDG